MCLGSHGLLRTAQRCLKLTDGEQCPHQDRPLFWIRRLPMRSEIVTRCSYLLSRWSNASCGGAELVLCQIRAEATDVLFVTGILTTTIECYGLWRDKHWAVFHKRALAHTVSCSLCLKSNTENIHSHTTHDPPPQRKIIQLIFMKSKRNGLVLLLFFKSKSKTFKSLHLIQIQISRSVFMLSFFFSSWRWWDEHTTLIALQIHHTG